VGSSFFGWCSLSSLFRLLQYNTTCWVGYKQEFISQASRGQEVQDQDMEDSVSNGGHSHRPTSDRAFFPSCLHRAEAIRNLLGPNPFMGVLCCSPYSLMQAPSPDTISLGVRVPKYEVGGVGGGTQYSIHCIGI
jgi:hypothetical protein